MSGVNVVGEGRRKNSSNVRNYSGFVVKFILIVLAFMGAFVGHLYLRQQSVRSAERTDDIKKQIMQVRAENRNLKIKVAELTGWRHISRMIVRFKLDLAPAQPGQIINIGVYTPEQAANIPLTPLKVASNRMIAPGRR
jgi:hypothetical protein